MGKIYFKPKPALKILIVILVHIDLGVIIYQVISVELAVNNEFVHSSLGKFNISVTWLSTLQNGNEKVYYPNFLRQKTLPDYKDHQILSTKGKWRAYFGILCAGSVDLLWP